MTSQALASLTATYTDSEGEEDMDEGQQTPENSLDIPTKASSEPNSPKTQDSAPKSASAPPSPKFARLVSYGHDDTVVSDEEAASVQENEDDMRRLSMETDTDEQEIRQHIDDSNEVTIPPEPPGKCPKELQDTIAKFYNKMVNEGFDMNKMIQDRKNFRNPSIYEKLIQFCDINELDTNYPPEIYDPLRWGKESYYEELAKVQKIEMDKREKEKKEKLAKIDFITGVKKSSQETEEDKKRKSKWDQAAPNSGTKLSIKPAGLVQAPLTSNVTGTKGTIISAFGSLPKKPKV